MTFSSALYRGELVHARHDAIAKRAFRYGVYMASLDLDELPALDRSLHLFSHRGRNLFAFDERDYRVTLGPGTSAREPDLRASLAALRAANGLAVPHTTRLVTNLRVAGYVFNPVSFFLDYDATGAITSAIAEVNNTYGGAFRYVLGPAQRLPDAQRVDSVQRADSAQPSDSTQPSDSAQPPDSAQRSDSAPRSDSSQHSDSSQRSDSVQHADSAPRPDSAQRSGSGAAMRPGRGRVGFRHVRELFVSPFLHGSATYDFWFDAPLDDRSIAIEMHVTRGDDGTGSRLFTARFTGHRAPLSDRALAAAALRYPLMTAQVIGLIHLEAIKMRLAGVPYRRPTDDHRPLAETDVRSQRPQV